MFLHEPSYTSKLWPWITATKGKGDHSWSDSGSHFHPQHGAQQLSWYIVNDKGSSRNTFPPSIFTGGLERSQDKGKGNLPCPPPPAWWSWQYWSSSPAKPSSRSRRSSPAWGLQRRRDIQRRYRWRSGRRKREGRKAEEEKREEEEGGEISHKSEKIAAITINIEALCNPCQGIE